jgi:hypothetical protein
MVSEQGRWDETQQMRGVVAPAAAAAPVACQCWPSPRFEPLSAIQVWSECAIDLRLRLQQLFPEPARYFAADEYSAGTMERSGLC